jgi:hypothetical protein
MTAEFAYIYLIRDLNKKRVSVVAKALRYKLEDREFENRSGEFLNLPKPSGRSRAWGLFSLKQK